MRERGLPKTAAISRLLVSRARFGKVKPCFVTLPRADDPCGVVRLGCSDLRGYAFEPESHDDVCAE